MQTVTIVGARAGQLLPFLLSQVDACRRRGERVLLLVPEQYTLQAERELVEGLHLPGLLDMEVLSPRRLMRRIREFGGHDSRQPLDDRGRSMALAQALSQEAEKLTYYHRVAHAAGLPDRLSALLTDFQRAGLTPDVLRDHAEALPEGAFRAKERDLALIWQRYDQLIAGRFADESQQQADARARLVSSGVMADAWVWVYGFDVIPRPMCELLGEAAGVCRKITVALTMDSRDAEDGRIFLTQRRSAAELLEVLRAHGVPAELRYLPRQNLAKEPALAHLEKYLFTRRSVAYEGDASAVSVHAAANPYAEAAFVARTLADWHAAGIPWGRMAVALAETSVLPGVLSTALRDAHIPHYVAMKDSASRHGLCRLLLGALRSIAGGYGREDVLHMAKSGFSPLTEREAQELENYAQEQGVDRGKWLKPFTRGDNAEEMEALRLRLMAPVEALHQRLKSAKTAAQEVEAVFRLLEEVDAYAQLMDRETELLARDMAVEAAQNRQVWQTLMDLLDQLHALLGEQRASMRDLARFVEAGLTGAVIAGLPPQSEAVLLGEAGHLMTGQIDALIAVGMQDGVLGSAMDSLLNENERRMLSDATHRAVGLTRQETAALRQSDFYRTLALPTRFLTLTCSQGGQDGGVLRPSGLIEDLKGLFPDLCVTGGVLVNPAAEPPLSPENALSDLALLLRDQVDRGATDLPPVWLNALRILWQSPVWHTRTEQLLQSLSAHLGDERLPPAQAKRLFTLSQQSISRLEGFAQCPYRHFVDYGLRPRQRREFVFERSELGNFYHAAMQGFAAEALRHPDWPNLPEDEVDRLMDQITAPLTASWAGGPLDDTPAQRLQGQQYVRTAKRAAWMFTKHAQNSRFTPVGEEIAFGEEGGLPPVILRLSDGQQVALRGKIDRVDRWQGDDGCYLRVIDYKSSRHDIDPTRLWYGLQLQLLLYLQAAAQGMGGEPAGAFYFAVRDPLVDAEEVKSAAEKAIAKQLQLEGVVLADARVVQAMDTAAGYSLGTIYTATGKLDSRAPAYSREELAALLAHTKEKAAEAAEGIRAGDIAVRPAAIADWTACQWCEYSSVCGQDPALPGGGKQELKRISRQELSARLSK